MIRVVEVSNRQALEEHRRAWEGLYQHAISGDSFESRDWLVPWLDAYWQDAALAFLFAYEDEELVGLLPLLRDDSGLIARPGALVSPVNPHVRRQEILASKQPELLLTAFLAHIRQRGFGWVELPQVPLDSALAVSLPGLARRSGFLTVQREQTSSFFADLSGGWDAYVSNRGRHTVHEMNRKARKLEKAGNWKFGTLAAVGQWSAAFDTVVGVESRSWKHANGTSIANEPGARSLYEGVTRLGAEKGRLLVNLLEHEGEPVAFVLCIADGTTLLALKTAYDEAYRKAAPGAVIMWHALRDAAERGFHRFDFLGDSAPWKESLGSVERYYASFSLVPALTVRGRAFHAWEEGLKPVARRLGVARMKRWLLGSRPRASKARGNQ